MTSSAKPERLIQGGLLVLAALMPFHAFLSVSLGTITGHMAIIQAWKEVLLLLLAGAGLWLVIQQPQRLRRLRRPWVLALGGFVVVALLVTGVARPGLAAAAFGAKTDLGFILAALLALLVSNGAFVRRLVKVLVAGAALAAAFSLIQIFILPPDALRAVGYGEQTIVPYQGITEGTSTLRFPGPAGGPNQFGTYLILPLCLAAGLFIQRRRLWQLGLFLVGLVGLVWTFSRGAWLGAATAVTLTVLLSLPSRARRIATLGTGLLLAGLLAAIPLALTYDGPWEYYLLHSSMETYDQDHRSDSMHARSLQHGTMALLQDPLGHGLGTAGPSTFRAGEVNIIENFWLQVGYETGVVGLVLLLAGLILLVRELMGRRGSPLALPAAAALVGVSLVGLVLPSWTDSTTALVTWIAAGAAAGDREDTHV